jgi:hypothetical protein
MSYMKELDIRIRSGGDDAVAAACELADLAKERRGYDETMRAGEDITDVVTVLRSVGFSAVSPEAGDSASLLLRVVTAAADEIEHLRSERRWIPVGERLPARNVNVIVSIPSHEELFIASLDEGGMWFSSDPTADAYSLGEDGAPTHWMPLPAPPQVTPSVADVISHAEPKGQGHASGQIPGCLVDHDQYRHEPPEVK